MPKVLSTVDKTRSCTDTCISAYLPFASMNQTLCLGLRHRNVQGLAPAFHTRPAQAVEPSPRLAEHCTIVRLLPPMHCALRPLPAVPCAPELSPAAPPFLRCSTWRKRLPALLKDGCFRRLWAGRAKLALSEKEVRRPPGGRFAACKFRSW